MRLWTVNPADLFDAPHPGSPNRQNSFSENSSKTGGTPKGLTSKQGGGNGDLPAMPNTRKANTTDTTDTTDTTYTAETQKQQRASNGARAGKPNSRSASDDDKPGALLPMNENGVHIIPGLGQPAKGEMRRTRTRNKLASKFLEDLHARWEKDGESILSRAAFEDPMRFAEMVAKLLPAKLEISDTTLEDANDDRFEKLLGAIERQLLRRGHGGAERGGVALSGKTIEGDAIRLGDDKPASLLPPVQKAD